jgi:hypothetical protein
MVQRQAKLKMPVARESAWDSPEFLGGRPKEWITSFAAALPDRYPNQANPVVVAVPETRDAIGAAIVGASSARGGPVTRGRLQAAGALIPSGSTKQAPAAGQGTSRADTSRAW